MINFTLTLIILTPTLIILIIRKKKQNGWKTTKHCKIGLTPFLFKPSETFESGIRKIIKWYMENEQWWRKVMDGSYQNWIEKNYV